MNSMKSISRSMKSRKSRKEQSRECVKNTCTAVVVYKTRVPGRHHFDLEGDPYEVLGVKRTADRDEITKHYKALALVYHPDKNNGGTLESTMEFTRIKRAHEILSDPELRKIYDVFGHGGLEYARQHDCKSKMAKMAGKSWWKVLFGCVFCFSGCCCGCFCGCFCCCFNCCGDCCCNGCCNHCGTRPPPMDTSYEERVIVVQPGAPGGEGVGAAEEQRSSKRATSRKKSFSKTEKPTEKEKGQESKEGTDKEQKPSMEQGKETEKEQTERGTEQEKEKLMEKEKRMEKEKEQKKDVI